MELPERVGRYVIEAELGRGGMAMVYLAYDPNMDRRVALKFLSPQFMYDPQFRDRFQREVHMIATLEHPAIVPVYDSGEHNQQLFLVMRYMTGGSLKERLQPPMPLPEIVRILERLGPALDKAHEAGIIHRDLKPDNVLFDAEELPYLADFGIARLAEATHTMTVAGTPSYMSPEQVHGDQELDGRSDIYALGVILFEMLTGQKPYTADTPTKLMMKHLLDPVPNVLDIRSDLPVAWQLLIERVMAKKPGQRFPTAAGLVEAVKGLAGSDWATIRGEPELVPRPAELPKSRMGKIPVRGWLVMAAIVVALLAWGSSYLLSRGEDTMNRPAAVITATTAVSGTVAAVTEGPTGTPEPEVAQIAEVTAHLAPSPEPTPSATDTAVPTAVPTSTATTVPTSTPTVTPSVTATATPSATTAPSDTPTATRTAAPSATVTPLRISSPTPEVTPANSGGSLPGATPTQATPELALEGDVGRILYTSGNALLTADPSWNTPRELGTVASDTCRSPASTVTGQSFNLYYGNFCPIGGGCLSPNGQYEVLSDDAGGHSTIVVRSPGGTDLTFIYQGELDIAEGIRWSPQSNSFLFVVRDTVHKGYPAGGFDQIIPTAYTPMFSPDGSLILYRKPIGPGVNDIFVSEANGANVRNVTNVSSIDKRCAAWRN